MRRFVWILLLCISAQFTVSWVRASERQRNIAIVNAADLPREARQTIGLIRQGGPYPYKKDGVVFGNFERRLPQHERGYYREFTVPSPGFRNRGARRIIVGKAGELYYTDDHYETFKRIRE
jgi:ribonuclease T1